jgi:Family of unknown function (DUF6455)
LIQINARRPSRAGNSHDASTGVVMGEIDDRRTDDPDGLLRRMIVLARISEGLNRGEPRRALLDQVLRRMILFSRMTDRLGIAEPRAAPTRAVMREAELGCMGCADGRRCRRWLDGKAPDDDYRAFCLNEALFDKLPHQHNVARPYGIGL